jgi:hypothetical protein
MLPALMAVGGLANIAGSLVGGRARRREQRAAQNQLKERMSAYENMQFTNPYANMQNTMEDLTVNTQQADFMAQQQQQGLANTMGALQGAAGGSGIAALAQAMANQQNTNLQQASASIGQQESRNQMAAAQQGANLQQLEAQGAESVQAREQSRTETLLGMSQQRLAAANQARQQATQQLVQGIGSTVGAGVGAMSNAGMFEGMEGIVGGLFEQGTGA